jgi:hypothetical protein
MSYMRLANQTGDAEAAASKTPLLNDLRRSINGVTFGNFQKRSF